MLGLYEVLLAHPFLVVHLGRVGTAPADPRVLEIMDAAIAALADDGLNPAAQVSAFRGLIAMCNGFMLNTFLNALDGMSRARGPVD